MSRRQRLHLRRRPGVASYEREIDRDDLTQGPTVLLCKCSAQDVEQILLLEHHYIFSGQRLVLFKPLSFLYRSIRRVSVRSYDFTPCDIPSLPAFMPDLLWSVWFWFAPPTLPPDASGSL